MKKIQFNKTQWHSILSVFILGAFVIFSIGSIPELDEWAGINSNLSYLGDGYYEENIDFKYFAKGKINDKGQWQGKTFIWERDGTHVFYTEEVNMVDGRRHGTSITTFADGHMDTVCYHMGEIVVYETQIAPAVNKEWASEILFTNNPETVNELEVKSGFDAAEVKAMLDTMQNMMLARTFDFNIFDTIYQDIQEELFDTRYDSIVAANAELSFFKGIELSKYDEFRIAVINRYLRGDNSLVYTLEHIHSNYLNLINSYGYTNLDIENFCFVFDSLMLSYGPLNLTDPFLVDSLDNRMVRALLEITGYDVLYGLKSLSLNNKYLSVGRYLKKQYDHAQTYDVAASPRQVAQLVVGLVYYKYIEGDKIRKALMEAYAYQNGIVLFPTVTTVFQSRNSSSSVTISGNVIDDGGGDITTRGFVWGTGFNPNYRDNVIAEDPGTGLFQSDINGLTEGVTYYVRSFATNSAGTQYGNCVEFTTNLAVNAEVNQLGSHELHIYPNPAKDETILRFRSDSPGNRELIITDLQGRSVYHSKQVQFENNSVRLDLSGFKSGIYNCRLTDGENQISRKLVVAK